MQVGTTAKVCSEALAINENGQVYLIDDERWCTPVPRFCGPHGGGILVSRTEAGYIWEEKCASKLRMCEQKILDTYHKAMVFTRTASQHRDLVPLRIAHDPVQQVWYRKGIDDDT